MPVFCPNFFALFSFRPSTKRARASRSGVHRLSHIYARAAGNGPLRPFSAILNGADRVISRPADFLRETGIQYERQFTKGDDVVPMSELAETEKKRGGVISEWRSRDDQQQAIDSARFEEWCKWPFPSDDTVEYGRSQYERRVTESNNVKTLTRFIRYPRNACTAWSTIKTNRRSDPHTS